MIYHISNICSNNLAQQEMALIAQAMQELSTELGGCVQFQQVQAPATGINHVIISKAGGPG